VIVGIDEYRDGKTIPEIPVEFSQPEWGGIWVGGSQREGDPIRTLLLAENSTANDPSGNPASITVPSFALKVVMDSQQPALVPELQEFNNRLLLYSDNSKKELVKIVPLQRGQNLIIDQASPKALEVARVDPQVIYDNFQDEASLQQKYKDAIVLLGYEAGDEQQVLPSGRRFGVEIHATAVSNILHDVYIYKLILIYSYLIIIGMALIAALMYTQFGGWLDHKIYCPLPWTETKLPIPVGLIVIGAIYLLVAFLTYRYTKVYLDVSYHLFALLVSYFFLWLFLKKLYPPDDSWSLES